MVDRENACESAREIFRLMISGDATLPETAEARHHLEDCPACREHLRGFQADDRLLAGFAAGHEQHVHELKIRAVNALPDSPVRRPAILTGWNWINASAPRRLAVAAALVIAVSLAVFFRPPATSFDAWADVLETVRQATSARFSLRDMGGSDVEARQVYSELGTAHETYENGALTEALYVDFVDPTITYVAHPLKLAARMTMDEAMLADFREHAPSETFNFLREYEHEDLGQRRVDGRRAVGIRVTDARFLAERLDHAELELWVDPETKLPIRFDVTGDMAGGTRTRHVRFYDFRWNEPVAVDAFRPEIPSGYDIEEGVHLKVDEEHFLDGLRLFADIVGRYPSALAYESLKAELWRAPGVRDHGIGETVLKMFRIRLASDFYGDLVRDGREVVYFGADVRPQDTSRALMRWKLGDGRYRVVFGDLSTETVDAARLLELEARR